MHSHGLSEKEVPAYPELTEVVESFTSLMATVSLFRDESVDGHDKYGGGNHNREVIKDTSELQQTWETVNAQFEGSSLKKQRTESEVAGTAEPEEEKENQKEEGELAQEPRGYGMEVVKPYEKNVAEAERALKVKMEIMGKLCQREQERTNAETVRAEDNTVGTTNLLPQSSQNMNRLERKHANQLQMIDNMYNNGAPLSWSESMTNMGLTTCVAAIAMDPTIKWLVVNDVRRLQEHLGVQVGLVDDVNINGMQMQDVGNGMEMQEGVEEYVGPATLGDLLDNMMQLAEQYKHLYKVAENMERVGQGEYEHLLDMVDKPSLTPQEEMSLKHTFGRREKQHTWKGYMQDLYGTFDENAFMPEVTGRDP